jgi:hypothetical protein
MYAATLKHAIVMLFNLVLIAGCPRMGLIKDSVIENSKNRIYNPSQHNIPHSRRFGQESVFSWPPELCARLHVPTSKCDFRLRH